MITVNQLQTIYPSLVCLPSDQPLEVKEYKWYQTNRDEIVGIKKSDLTDREMHMLDLFLTPYRYDTPYITEREQQWLDAIYHNQIDSFKKNNAPERFRFVFFQLSERDTDQETFREAIQGLFSSAMPIIWENAHSGFIIEESVVANQEEDLSYEPIIDVLMSDFYMKLSFYVSEYNFHIDDAPAHFTWSKHCFQIANRHLNKDVTSFLDVLPYLYLDHMPGEKGERIITGTLQVVVDEPELLETVRVFLECNSNATVTAKKLYMHRNSLQYRIDKFIEKTGIDVRQFHEALPTYMALLQLKAANRNKQ